jgi:hypothetical protein
MYSFDKSVRFSIGAVENIAAAGEIVHFFFPQWWRHIWCREAVKLFRFLLLLYSLIGALQYYRELHFSLTG